MKGTNKGIVLALSLGLAQAGVALAEPSYLIYPSSPTVFRFDVNHYELIHAGQPKFDSGYAIANEMLWDCIGERVPIEVYRAPHLVGFEPSSSGINEFVTYSNQFDIVVDGFGVGSRTLGNLCLRFWPDPARTAAILSLDGLTTDRLTIPLPSLEVTTPLANGYYSDTRSHAFSWVGAPAMQIIVFSDKDADGAFAGTPTCRIVANDAAVPVSEATWGRVKALYR